MKGKFRGGISSFEDLMISEEWIKTRIVSKERGSSYTTKIKIITCIY